MDWSNGFGVLFWKVLCSRVYAEKRKKLFNGIAVSSIFLFIIIRYFNYYGDPVPWQEFPTQMQTVMSFFNLTKCPPSLDFLLVTMAGAFFFLGNSEHWKGKAVAFFAVFGRVPFFYYILHLYVIRILATLAAELTGFGWELMVQNTFEIELKGFGFKLPIVYLIWVAIILMLYPACKWYDNYKSQHREKWWLSYL